MAAQLSEQDYDGDPKLLSLLKFQANGGVWQRTGPTKGDGMSQIARTGSRRSLMY
jgi:hypothetical protein